MTLARCALFLLMAAVLATAGRPAFAGPLRDRLAERRAERMQAEEEDAADAPALPPGARMLRDLAYGSDPRQRIDAYLPPHAHDAPVIFMVHGGAWRTGDKASRSVVANKVARWLPEGFIFISANYRLLPEANPLQQAEDVARALAYAQRQAPAWGGDPDRFVLMGHSAGAHLIALIAAAPALAERLGARPWRGAITLDSAVLDVPQTMASPHYRFYDAAFGADTTFWHAVSPLQNLTAGAAPFLLVCSSTRPDAPCTQAQAFAEKAGTLGIRAEVCEEALTHKEINAELGRPGAYTAAVDAFLRALP